MKQQQSIVKRGICRSVFLAVSAVLACAIAVLLAGGIGTNTSAKAASTTPDEVLNCTSPFMGRYVVDATDDVFLSKVRLRNNINNEIVNTDVYLMFGHTPIAQYGLFYPKRNPFPSLKNYVVTSVTIDLERYAGNTGTENYGAFVWGINEPGTTPPNSSLPELNVTYKLELAPTVPLPEEPTKEGHHFVGWYYDAEFTQPYDDAPIFADTQLYAKFEIDRFKVTYDSNGGSGVGYSMVDWNAAAPTPETKRTGYNFLGWFREDGTQYNGEAITEDTTLTARWDIQVFTVTFYVDGKEYTAMQVPYGTSLATAMKHAKVADYGVKDIEGTRISKYSTITEDTAVLIHELNGWEKYGDFVGRSPWYTWLMVGLGSALAVAFSITVVLLVKARR